MKTSGVSCETKFGLLGFLGHPSIHRDNDDIERHSALLQVLESCVYIQRQKERAEV